MLVLPLVSIVPTIPGATRSVVSVERSGIGMLLMSSEVIVYSSRVSSGFSPTSAAVTSTVTVALPTVKAIFTPATSSVET